MLFSSTTFLFLFLPVTLMLYYAVPRTKGNVKKSGHTLRNFVLLFVSLIFYGWGEPIYIVLMLVSIFVGYVTGFMVYSPASADTAEAAEPHKTGKSGRAKAGLLIALIYNIGVLAVFKYTDFFIENLNNWFGLDISLLKLALPLGISFYSFQMMSYTIDVYRSDAKLQRNFISLAAYLTLFPQLIAGPIVRYQTVADQIDERRESFDDFSRGVCRFVAGLGKKVLLANTIGELYTTLSVLPPEENSVCLAWLASFAFTFQIYFDFSGYSDMAIGLGKMFGFSFLENFNYPYISKSITEFWRRWHISLSSWFRDYVYIPLGGSRAGTAKTVRNIFIVWFLTGFWHGAAWNFIIWGLYFFVLLMIEKLFLLKRLSKCPSWMQHVYTLFFVNLSWVIFSYDSLGTLQNALKNMFGFGGLPFYNTMTGYYMLAYLTIFIILILASTPYPKQLYGKWVLADKKEIASSVLQAVLAFFVLFLSTACLASDSFNPFLYFRF
ncbi:MAG: MBOAT family protein [Lachnospiraceae bacterium]|nr:MBOAT family protein [Lachnospiraceae bacterium]